MRRSVNLSTLLAAAGSGVRGAGWPLRASGLVMILSTVWFALNVPEQHGPLLLLWLPNQIEAAIAAVMFWRNARATRLPAPTRRFWRHLAIAVVLVGAGTVVQTVNGVEHPLVGGQHIGVLDLTLDACAILIVIWALLRLPLRTESRGERLRVALDTGTVMVATGVFIWHFHTRHLLTQGIDPSATLVSAAFVAVLGLVGVFAVAKVTMSSFAFIEKASLRLLALAIFVGCLSPLPEYFLPDRPYLVGTQLIIPIVLFVGAAAAHQQLVAVPGAARSGARRRFFSVVPYIAVGAIDGLLIWVLAAPDENGELLIGGAAVLVTGLVVLRQITAFQDNQRLVARLDHSATHDALTQLPNRRLFSQRLHRALDTGGEHCLSIALIDLDDFKVVNDTLGHDIGDALLVAVAERLLGCVRPCDTVARLGGDEFVLILDGVEPSGADSCAERIIAALGIPVLVNGHELMVRASIGIADGHTGDEVGDLLREADMAMYAAKAVGGSGYRRYEADMSATVAIAADVAAALRVAIPDNQLFLLYQPIVALDTGALLGVEALVRWAHPERGTVAPDEFIPVAERTGLIVPLGRWVLRRACEQLATWSERYGDGAPTLNVNVSARELREPSFADEVAAVLADTGIAPDRLTLEVTETAVFEIGASVTNLWTLQKLGVQIALDDFGTGQSTLTLLQTCPVDQLKLDRSFTQAEGGDQPIIAAGVLHLALALGLRVVAEGVETRAQADRLRLLGYVAAQGFYFSAPIAAARIGEILAKPWTIIDMRTESALQPVPAG